MVGLVHFKEDLIATLLFLRGRLDSLQELVLRLLLHYYFPLTALYLSPGASRGLVVLHFRVVADENFIAQLPLACALLLLLLFGVNFLGGSDDEVGDGDCSDHQDDEFVLLVKLLGSLDEGIESLGNGSDDGFDAVDDGSGERLEEAGELEEALLGNTVGVNEEALLVLRH